MQIAQEAKVTRETKPNYRVTHLVYQIKKEKYSKQALFLSPTNVSMRWELLNFWAHPESHYLI